MTPVEIADYAAKAQDALKVEILDMLRASEEFGWVFDKLKGWDCYVSSSTDFPSDLRAKWENLAHGWKVALDVRVCFAPMVQVQVHYVGAFEERYLPGINHRWSKGHESVDAALAEFEKLKEGINV